MEDIERKLAEWIVARQGEGLYEAFNGREIYGHEVSDYEYRRFGPCSSSCQLIFLCRETGNTYELRFEENQKTGLFWVSGTGIVTKDMVAKPERNETESIMNADEIRTAAKELSAGILEMVKEFERSSGTTVGRLDIVHTQAFGDDRE